MTRKMTASATRMSTILALCVLCLLLISSAGFAAQSKEDAKEAAKEPPPPRLDAEFSDRGIKSVDPGEVYRLGPGDIVRVNVWKEDELTRDDILVRPDGRMSMPLVDDLVAAGLTPMELKRELTNVLKDYVEEPKVFIELRLPRSSYYMLLGNINKPGRHTMRGPVDILRAISEGEGFNEWADKNSVILIRGFGPKQRRYLFEYDNVLSGENLDQNIILKPGDVIVVP